MKHRTVVALTGWLLALALYSATSPARAAELAISCGAVGMEYELCRSGVDAWSAETGHSVQVVSTPSSSSERLALYQQLLAAGAPDADLFQIDIVWPGILASHFIDLSPYVDEAQLAQHFPAMIANNRVDGRLVALPWFSSAGLLFYRKDLLARYGEPMPETWGQLTDIAGRIQRQERASGQDRFWGYVWQGRAYEGLTCDALEWVASYGGGRVVEPDGQVSINNPQAIMALEQAASWVGTISPPGVLNYAEEEARGVFQSGNALFMRNWPYAWALAQSGDSPVRDKVGIAPLPRGDKDGRPASTLGGWQLAVSRYSRHPALAAELALYLTSRAEQKRRAIVGAYIPTRPALYRDPEVLAANPFFADLVGTLEQAVTRPSAVSGGAYNRVSNRFWNAVHAVLSGRQSAQSALAALGRDLKRILRRVRR
jgi:trehalose/maltose transport system substrate-binding protein